MKSRPLRIGGVGEGKGLGRIEGANKRIEQLAESRVQPQNTQSPDTLSTVGICSVKRTTNTQPLFFISHRPASLSTKSHTRSMETGAFHTITNKTHRQQGQRQRVTNTHLHAGTFTRYQVCTCKRKISNS